MPAITDPARLRRSAAATCLIVAPLVEIASVALMPSITGRGADQLASIAAHRGAAIASLCLDGVGLLFFAGAIGGMVAAVGRAFARWANLGAVLAAAGIADLLFMNGINALGVEMVAPGADRAGMAALVDRMQASPGWSAVLTLSMAVSAGLILLAVGLVRARAVPRAAAACIVAGAVLDVVGFASGVLAIAAVSFAVMLPGFAAVARSLRAADDRAHAGAAAPATATA